jgi:hypothetical protein
MKENTSLETLQQMAVLISGTDTLKNAKPDAEKIKTYTKPMEDGAEFQLNAASGNYNAVCPGAAYCVWFWLDKPDPDPLKEHHTVTSGAVYLGKGIAHVSPTTDPEAAKCLIEAGNLFSHFAESYFLCDLGGDTRFSRRRYPELQDTLDTYFTMRSARERKGGKR